VVILDAPASFDAADLAATLAAGPADAPGLVLLGAVAGDEQLPAYLAGRPWAYLPREAGAEQLLAAVRAVAGGLVAIDPALAAHLLAGAGGEAPIAATAAGEELTPREREVLAQIALGLPNKTIARRLGISEHTAKFHVAAVMSKLGAASRTEAVRLGARRGLVAL
jgi:DNA-binding NarL/FixJ family response regulator